MPESTRVYHFQQKLASLREWLADHEADALLLTTVCNFAWLTGGRAFVSLASESACGQLLVTAEEAWLIAPANEVPRLLDEELAGLPLRVIEYPWYLPLAAEDIPSRIPVRRILKDQDYDHELSRLRSVLNGVETERLEWLGRRSAEILEDLCLQVQPGMSETEIAGQLSDAFWGSGIEPVVMNIAADERACHYRHPIPTAKVFTRQLTCSLCTRRWGLHVTLTRVVHMGPVCPDLARKHEAATRIEALAMSLSRPGARISDIFTAMQAAYRESGYEAEWQCHPVGGRIGYKPREYDVIPGDDHILCSGEAFCWNPTIRGTKSEDSLLIEESGARSLTSLSGSVFPSICHSVEGRTIRRPDILVR